MKYHVGVVTISGTIKGKAVESKEEAEEYILEMAETIGIKVGRIRNLETGEEETINFNKKES